MNKMKEKALRLEQHLIKMGIHPVGVGVSKNAEGFYILIMLAVEHPMLPKQYLGAEVKYEVTGPVQFA